MSRYALPLLLCLGCACGPDLAPMDAQEGSGEGSGASTDDGAEGDTTTGDGADGSSTGEFPDHCANLDPAAGDICYVEHLIDVPGDLSALSDQNSDGLLDLVVAQGLDCCGDREEPTGLWLLTGTDEGLFGTPQLLFETTDTFDALIPMGPGPDGQPRVLTARVDEVSFLSESVRATVVGQQFIDVALPIPSFFPNEGRAADLDGDGILDFVVSRGGEITFALSQPQGTFGVIEYDMDLPGFLSLMVADDDGDGVDDLLVMGDGSSYSPRGGFVGDWSHTRPGPVPGSIPEADQWTMDIGTHLLTDDCRLLDLDDDGHLDLWARHFDFDPVAMATEQDRLVIARGTHDGFAPQVETLLDGPASAMEPLLAPLDGPARAAVHIQGEPELMLMTLSESLEFEPTARLALTHPPGVRQFSSVLHAADLNADGYSDFVILVETESEFDGVAVLLSQP